jgi:hypothetical protein
MVPKIPTYSFRNGVLMAKFMLSLRDENFQLLITEAQERGISIQELIRAVIIPDWVKQATVLKVSTSKPVSGNGNGRETLASYTRMRKPGNGSYTAQF